MEKTLNLIISFLSAKMFITFNEKVREYSI